jgi:hypothetical protein
LSRIGIEKQAMKLRIVMIDWEYPEDGRIPKPEIVDLSSISKNDVMLWYATFANGVVIELKAEGDSEEALQFMRGLALGAGSCQLIDALPEAERKRLWLYEDGYDCYMQGSGPRAAYIFVNPEPQPDMF